MQNGFKQFETRIFRSNVSNVFEIHFAYKKKLTMLEIVASLENVTKFFEKMGEDLASEPFLEKRMRIHKNITIMRQYKLRPRRFTSSLPLRRGKL
jgi:hypothetical protein